jgi:hypothetical protein
MLNPNLVLLMLTFALAGFLIGGTTGAVSGALVVCILGLIANFIDVFRR